MQTHNHKIRIAIVDDEAPIRQLLQSYLADFQQVQIAAAFSNGADLIENIIQINPMAVFLDIEMPGLDGLSAAVRLKQKCPEIFIIFVTGHTKYAADAFGLDAVDFLIKPITIESIARAISKIEKFLGLNKYSDASINENRITIKRNHELYFIDQEEIFFIAKELKKSIVHTNKGIYETSEQLTALEKKLNKSFFRCHKSFIINVKKIEKIYPIADRIYEVTFYNYQSSVTMGKKKMEELYSIFI